MKELDKSKKYDLSKLTDEQLNEFYDKHYKKRNSFDAFKKLINGFYFMCLDNCDYWEFNSNNFKHDFIINCATELFEDEKEYSVGQPYNKEKLLNNKPMTEEEKELWIFVYKESVKSSSSNGSFVPIPNHKEKADQAVKDFREALKM